MTMGEVILDWMNANDRTLSYLARASELDADLLIALITGRSMAADHDRETLAAAMGMSVGELMQSSDSPAVADTHPLRCYTVREVAALLQVSEDTVRKEMATGALHYLYVAVVPWIGRSAGRARGARRSLLGEPGHNPGLHRRQVGHPSRRSGRSERIQGL